MKISERIKELRKSERVSQGELADAIGVGQTTVSGWESGGKEPTYTKLVKLADFFGVTADYLLCRTDYRDGYIIKTPTELASAGVELVEKSGSDTLTPAEVAAIRKMLEREEGK